MKNILHFKEKCIKGAHTLENDVETQGMLFLMSSLEICGIFSDLDLHDKSERIVFTLVSFSFFC